MASSLLLLLLCFIVSSSLSAATPLLGCGFGDRQMSPSERIRNFLDCLRSQGNDEELLTELKKSFDVNATPNTLPLPSNCSPETASYDLSRFPYCSGMSDLQCRTLVLVLDSLVSASSSRPPNGGGSSSVEKVFRDPVQVVAQESPSYSSSFSSLSSEDDEETQAALMNIILARFNDILEEYKRWRMETSGRQKRSAVDSPVPVDGKSENKVATSGQNTVKSPEASDKSAPEDTSSKRMRAVRTRRQAAPPALPFKIPAKLTPEMQAVLEGYLAWREKNGYGKMSGRWG